MKKKILVVPLAPHIVKFLTAEYEQKNGCFILRRWIIPPKWWEPAAVRRYFREPDPKFIYIKVSSNDSKLYKIYAWIQHLDAHFVNKMVDYVAVRLPLMTASESIREYLKLYGITESEYGWETAYKRWQRSSTYAFLRKERPKKPCQVSVE